MKKYIFIIFSIITSLLFAQNVKAETINISCQREICNYNSCTLKHFTEVSGSDILYCALGYNSQNNIKDISANLSLSKDLEFLELTNVGTEWTGQFGKDKFSITHPTGKNVENTFLTLKLKVKTAKPNTDFKIELNNIVMKTDNKSLVTSPGKFNFKNSECNTGLKSLKIYDVNFTPKFSMDTTEYNIETYKDRININAQAECYKASISGASNLNLSLGSKVYPITVTSPTGGKRVYNLTINRLSNEFMINKLASLSTKVANIEFKPDNYNYYIDIKNDITKIDFDYSVTDKDKTFVEIIGNENLSVGSNSIGIRVKSNEKGVPETVYTVFVNRKEKASLKNIKVANFDLAFNPNTYKYTIKTKEYITNIDVKYEVNDENDKVSVTGNTNLKRGKNKILVTVLDNVDQKTIYTIILKQPSYTWIIVLIIFIVLISGAIFGYKKYLDQKKGPKLKYRGYVKPQ